MMDMDLAMQNTAVMPEASTDPAPPSAPADFSPHKSRKLLYILGGVAVILLTLVLAVSFFGQDQSTLPGSDSTKSTEAVSTSGWTKYTNQPFFYELSLPPKWIEIKHSPRRPDIAIFDLEDAAILELTAQKVIAPLEEYLSIQDATTSGSIKPTKSTQVKVGEYDATERSESWSAVGLQVISTYVKIQDMLYTLTLIPGSGKSAITSESLIRNYHAALTTFRLTDTSQLGLDLKDYQSTKVAGLAFKAFSLKYPQTWVLTDSALDNSLDVSIYRNNYELTISQKAVGGAVCLFNDSPPFEGSSGDLRNKQYAEFNTGSGAILRRYFNVNAGDKSTMFFCEKQADGPYFQTPLSIGGLVYNVPAKYDADIIKEMDEIVKSITVTPESTSP